MYSKADMLFYRFYGIFAANSYNVMKCKTNKIKDFRKFISSSMKEN